jgi:uncharacterized repeat protein (TIGR03803 family)
MRWPDAVPWLLPVFPILVFVLMKFLPLATTLIATLVAPIVALAQTTTLVTLNSNGTGEQLSTPIVQGADGTLYGASRQGGANGNGFVFKIQPDGSGYQTVFAFPAGQTVARLPEYAFILGRDGVLYGTTELGGTATFGTIYKVNTDGSGFAVLRSFTAGGTAVVADGGAPRGGLVHASDGFLYGLTTTGTAASTSTADRNGVIYRIATDGSGYRIIFSFDGGSSATNGQLPNVLIQGRDGNLYGTTRAGGPRGAGTVFTIRTDGTGFAILQGFSTGAAAATTGAAPDSDLVQAGDGYLYGTTIGGGPQGDGTLYRLLPDGSAFEIVHAFNRNITIRGGRPRGAFFQGSDGYLYGRTEDGGAVVNGGGIIFRVRTDGTAFQTLQSVGFGFPGRLALMQGRDGNLYGAGLNTQFLRIIPPLPLAITEQPRSQTVAAGSNVTFSVTARGATRYQWFRNGAAITGATNATYTLNNVTAAANATYTVLAQNSSSGAISVNEVLFRNAEAELSKGAVLLVAAPNPGRLINLSVRTTAGTGAEALIAGFVVGGTGTKQVLVRGIGPTLGVFGVTGALTEPRLALFDATSTQLAVNAGWGGGAALANAFTQVGAFQLNATSRDAALLSPLATAAYSAQVTPAAGAPGVALIEAYDADAATSPTRFINLSARTLAGTGAQTLIAGFVLSGNVPRTLLIRGIGPTLGAFGVTGVLANPRLELRNAANAVVATNAGWAGAPALAAAFVQVAAFPLPATSGDAALLVTLAPGQYTAQVAGTGGATGVALVEVYEVP